MLAKAALSFQTSIPNQKDFLKGDFVKVRDASFSGQVRGWHILDGEQRREYLLKLFGADAELFGDFIFVDSERLDLDRIV